MKRLLPWLVVPLCAGPLVLRVEPLRAQLPAAPAASREDSLRALRAARSRQASFERTRRHNLPTTWGGGGGDCDERIGRFCLHYDDDNPVDWQPPEEPKAIVSARDRLLQELDSAASVIPGDGWVAGQRVRYLLEARGFEAARQAATECRADAWWCDALRAFAEHSAGKPGAADSAFTDMLGAMPDELRREWTDLSTILDGRALRRYRQLPDLARAEFEDRFWTLADPLLGTPGNEVRSEHFTRNILDRLQERAESTDDLAWGDDLREILIRFGWPSGWEQVRPGRPLMTGEGVSLISHYPNADLDLMPPPELLTDSFNPTAGIWDDERRRPRASYPLARGGERLRWFTPFSHQIAVFRGGDSALVVAAYELPADSLEAGARVDASLAVRTSPKESPEIVRRRGAGTRAVMVASAPQRPVLVSLEVVADVEPRAGRARLGIDIPPLQPAVLAASDLLIFDATGDALPQTRAEAIDRARGSLHVRPGERIGVYWELYGLESGRAEALDVSLRMVGAETGWLRRLAERTGVVREAQPIRMSWGETADNDDTLRRSLALQVPANLRPGAYNVELMISSTGRDHLIVRRTLQVVP